MRLTIPSYLTTISWILLLFTTCYSSNIFIFENAADLKFFVGISLPWKVWKYIASTTTTQHREDGYTSRTVEVKENCQDIDKIYISHHPILFKKCINPNHSSLQDFTFFADQQQNVFPSCAEKKRFRRFMFESFENITTPIIEDVPCSTSTLEEKLSKFLAHELNRTDTTTAATPVNASSSTTDGIDEGDDFLGENSYFEVHTYALTSENQKQQVHETLSHNMLIKNIHDIGLTSSSSSSSKMIMPVLTYFLHAGRSAVYYLHAHMDHFLSFCLTETKTWMLIDPYYLDDFTSVWSGNAEIMIKENTLVPRITVTQEKGDILFIPPWWIHQTMVRKRKKNIGFNIHFGVAGQISTAIPDFMNKYIGDTAFFYRNAEVFYKRFQ